MYRVREGRQGRVNHQLVLVLVCDQVKDEVQGVFVYGQTAVVKDDISCIRPSVYSEGDVIIVAVVVARSYARVFRTTEQNKKKAS